MPNYVYALLVIIGAVAFGVLLIFLFTKISKKKLSVGKKIVTMMLSIILITTLSFTIYVNIYYHATSEVEPYLKSNENVKVEEKSYGYLFDGKDASVAIAFYPGAKVESKSYAALAFMLADRLGADVYLFNATFHIPFFSLNAADNIVTSQYEYVYMMGHSLGGAVATDYANKHLDSVDGIIYLASYAKSRLKKDFAVLSIVASNDKVINWSDHDKATDEYYKKYTEIMIMGGNHSQFGYYGHQSGDGEATITASEQHQQIVDAITNFIYPDVD